MSRPTTATGTAGMGRDVTLIEGARVVVDGRGGGRRVMQPMSATLMGLQVYPRGIDEGVRLVQEDGDNG